MSERKEFFCVFLSISAVMVVLWAVLPHEVFFTVDSGIKLIQIDNLLASHYGSVALRYNGSDIDPNLAISPFQLRPSVYVKDGKGYSLFPLLFPLLSSPFYALLGYAGLYVLPLGSAIACMPLVYAIARRFVPHRQALLAVASVMLATPMCFYAQTFWEHTPAACIVLAAVWLLLRCGDSAPQAAASGLLLGLGVWLRTEIALLAGLLYLVGLRSLGRRRAILTSMAAATVPLAGLLVFNRLVYGEWLGHIARNIATMGGQDTGLPSTVIMRIGFLWTSLLGMNAPQTLTAQEAGWERSFDLVRSSNGLEFLAFCAIVGIFGCSAIAYSLALARAQGADGQERSQSPAQAFPRAMIIQIGLLLVLAAAVASYVLTFRQDRSPLVTVLKSGGVFTFSPFLAMVFIWPLLRIEARPWGREFKWLFYTMIAYAVIMPPLAPNNGGIRYGARYLLPAIALLAILAVAAFGVLCEGSGRRLFQVVLVVLLALSVVIEARGCQLLYHKKAFSRDFTEALMHSPAQRTAATVWWLPFDAPQVVIERKVHIIYNARSSAQFLHGARRAGDAIVNIVVLGRKESLAPIEGTVVIGRTEVLQPFDTYFNITIFTVSLQ